jgi:hypothetical protein
MWSSFLSLTLRVSDPPLHHRGGFVSLDFSDAAVARKLEKTVTRTRLKQVSSARNRFDRGLVKFGRKRGGDSADGPRMVAATAPPARHSSRRATRAVQIAKRFSQRARPTGPLFRRVSQYATRPVQRARRVL